VSPNVTGAGHNQGTSLREDAGYDEKCLDEKTQVRSVAEDLPHVFHAGLSRSSSGMKCALRCRTAHVTAVGC